MSLYRAFLLSNETHANACIAFIRANWKKDGLPLTVEIREKGDKRSVEQNRRLHALLRDISETAWVNGKQFDAETWKEHFRRAYIGTEEIILPSGEKIERGISTTTLNVEEFNKFMGQIELYAAEELGVVLA